jgi:hypothetical protein
MIVKYPRTPHLFGTVSDDKHLGKTMSELMVTDLSLIVEEKLDGTQVGIQFDSDGKMILQSRGSEITEGGHPQFNVFKKWCAVKRSVFEERLANRYLMFGEWLYAKHSIHYRALTHYFFEYDIYDKFKDEFLSLNRRMAILDGSGVESVPIVLRGPTCLLRLKHLIGPSRYRSSFHNPVTHSNYNIMEGLYLRTESDGRVTGRAKFVRPEFIDKAANDEHWSKQKMEPNVLADGVDIWGERDFCRAT